MWFSYITTMTIAQTPKRESHGAINCVWSTLCIKENLVFHIADSFEAYATFSLQQPSVH
jgi:hypothetical protein